jgi:UDP-2,3-diacylglucosamine hydrolase
MTVDAPANASDAGSAPIGLLAGSGRFPMLFAEAARRIGRKVVCIGIHDEASEELIPLVDRFRWMGGLKFGGMARHWLREGVREVVMAGKVQKTRLYQPFALLRCIPDLWSLRMFVRHWRRRADNRDDTMLLTLINEFQQEGLTFRSALDFCPELLVREGILTRRRSLSTREEDDIRFGWTMAKELGRLDIGQSVVVKDKAVIAVEAIEGTDKAILRAGELCRMGGFTVVKVAKPQQDMRFDVPTIGEKTIETIHKAGGRMLAIEAGKTILLDEPATLELADRLGITIVARAA